MNFNKVIIGGRLTRDPDSRITPQGKHVANFSLAINEKRTDHTGNVVESVNFFDVTAWAKTAELVERYVKKGSTILVEGKLQQETWTDKATGQNRSKVSIRAESIQFVGTKTTLGSESVSASESQSTSTERKEGVPF